MKFHEEVLGRSQGKVLRQLGQLMTARQFYLGGGTAIALYLGHRQSVDLDWFTHERIEDVAALAGELRHSNVAFATRSVSRGTLHGTVSRVRTSLLEYRYALLRPLVECGPFGCQMASLDDLACMKLSAVTQRGAKRDFLDLYAIGERHCPLAQMLDLYRQKYDVRNISHVLYSLAYFDDADKEPTPRMLWNVDWKQMKRTIQRWVRTLP